MMGFRDFMESTLGQELNVPQNPVHHPEGKVARHTLLVRAALPAAINMLREKKAADPDGPLANLDLTFEPHEIDLLRIAAWMHDIGKGNALDPETLSAHGHEDPDKFIPAMRRLGEPWTTIWSKAGYRDRADVFFAIKHHMSLDDDMGIRGRRRLKLLVGQDGRYKNERKIRLLLALLLMDRMGRGSEPGIPRAAAKQFALANHEPARAGLQGLYTTADTAKKQWDREAGSKPAPDSPDAFVAMMRAAGKPDNVIAKALKGKRPDLTPDQINAVVLAQR